MNARDFAAQISDGLMDGERFADAAVLVDVIADARARGGEPGAAEYQFALTFLCFFFDPVKNESYQARMRELRQAYAGISDSREFRTAFERSLGTELIEARNIQEACQISFEALFVTENEPVEA